MKHLSTCSLCEACCACVLHIEDEQIVKVLPDTNDPLSQSFMCQKGRAIPELEAHPLHLNQPMIRRDGVLSPATWEEAFSRIEDILAPILAEHGPDALAIYLGNGAAHNFELSQYIEPLLTAAGTKNFFTSGTVDQVPRQVVSGLLYGSIESVPVPDIDRCDLICIIGANPVESNGSLWTTPGILRRLAQLKSRGGKIAVVDPQHSRTAKLADFHLAIRPGTDAWLLAAVARELFEFGEWRESRLAPYLNHIDKLIPLFDPFTIARASEVCGLPAEAIVNLVEQLKLTSRAAIYGRMGVTTQRRSSLTVWLMDLVNILAGNLDTEGGVMFPKPLASQTNTYPKPEYSEGFSIGKWHSRVSHYPEVMGELPVRCLHEEIHTDGPGKIRAMICMAANPRLSNTNAPKITAALESLEALICLDIFVNETGQLADVVLPSPPKLARCNYDRYFYQFTVRNYARYTQSFRELKAGERDDREIILRLMAILMGLPWDADIEKIDEDSLLQKLEQERQRPNSRIAEVSLEDLKAELFKLEPKERRLDLDLRNGPYGDAFTGNEGISLESLKENPNGLDLGALQPRIPELLRTRSDKIEIYQEFAVNELRGLADEETPEEGEFRLVGRRKLASNNSWMHILPSLQNDRNRCELLISCEDASKLNISDGETIEVSRAQRSIRATAKVTEDIRPGVVSLPHGWGHNSLPGVDKLMPDPGVNVNELTDDADVDVLTNTNCLNGYTVKINRL